MKYLAPMLPSNVLYLPYIGWLLGFSHMCWQPRLVKSLVTTKTLQPKILGVGVMVAVGVIVGVLVLEGVKFGVIVTVGVGVKVGVGVIVFVGVTVKNGVIVGEGVGVGVRHSNSIVTPDNIVSLVNPEYRGVDAVVLIKTSKGPFASDWELRYKVNVEQPLTDSCCSIVLSQSKAAFTTKTEYSDTNRFVDK